MGFKNCYFKIKSAIAPVSRATGARCSLRGNVFLLMAALGISALALIVVIGCPAAGGGNGSTSAPSAPAAPTLTVGNAALSVAWEAPNDNGSAITDYDVRYKDASSDSWTNWSHDGTTDSTTLTDLTNDLRYQVQVRATNAVGDGPWSSSASATPLNNLPSAPATPTLTAGNAQISVRWSAPSNTGGSAITGYIVHYRAGSSGSWTTQSHSGTGTSTTITGLTSGTSYQVRVRATNSNGSGAWSGTASAQPTGASLTISNVIAFGSGEGSVTGARTISDAISGAPSNATLVVRKVVRKSNNSTISSHNFFIGSDRRIKVGNRSATSDAFTPPAVDGSADVYTLTVGCSACNDATVDILVERRIAFFNIGRHQGDFGYAACYNWLNTASTLATDISNDGFAASTARFFGSQGANAPLGSTTIGSYTFPEIATHSNALNLSGNATARLLQTYTISSNTVSKVTVIDGNTHTIGQIADVNSDGAFQHNTGGPISRASGGGSLTNHFWSFTDGRLFDSSYSCTNATSNSSSTNGFVGNRTSIDSVATGGLRTDKACDDQSVVLCVAK